MTRAVDVVVSRPDRWIRCTAGRRVSSASRRRCDGCAPTSVGPVGADQHDRPVEQVPGEELEEVPGDGVGPVEVLDPDRDGPVGAEVADNVEDRREQAAGATVVVPRGSCPGSSQRASGREALGLGEQVGAGAADLAEQVSERRQRDDVTADGHATPDVEAHPRPLGGLCDQRRLPDPSVPSDEQDRRDTGLGVREGALEQGELVGSSDEVGVLGRSGTAISSCAPPQPVTGCRPAAHLRGPARCGRGALTETVDPEATHASRRHEGAVMHGRPVHQALGESSAEPSATGGGSSASSSSPCSSPRSTTRSSTSPCRSSSATSTPAPPSSSGSSPPTPSSSPACCSPPGASATGSAAATRWPPAWLTFLAGSIAAALATSTTHAHRRPRASWASAAR